MYVLPFELNQIFSQNYYSGKGVTVLTDKNNKISGVSLLLRSMWLTLAAIGLLLLGYFGAWAVSLIL